VVFIHQTSTSDSNVISESRRCIGNSMVRNLDVHLDSDVTMTSHFTATVRTCSALLQQIQSVVYSQPRAVLVKLLRALVIGKVDDCSAVLVGVSRTQLTRLQSILNAATQLVFSARRSEHVCHSTPP
jgi:hypothetical protein